ncbi:hypothetical protein ABZ816_17040 [Actinosynnema sp. NPDC047251]|uniref:Uncharacterized protein n=1 Tax=Saccharothrix espanaensis (strain ATCC 51144 / DSM 44229 / JCM 9112 / NBRC 15066 / NRRL 15764) TaxID=1179773 RepID=K0JWG8_SACES|nr:hypothetical protein [Saccharothrix espanaensis]CCH30396.1 hypothetical protein BN6_30910 [Saccharothrix espanaensis DSM 44229]
MRRDIAAYAPYQVFLNHPYDKDFRRHADALGFAVVAAGLVPVSARDLSSPDQLRLEMIFEAIRNCHYSLHDLSRAHGEGPDNLARMNMPLEMGMALYHALDRQRVDRRCAFFVPARHDFRRFASDLAGLDPKVYDDEPTTLLAGAYEWLRAIVPMAYVSSQPTVDVVDAYREFTHECTGIESAERDGVLTHDEAREVMYQVCGAREWWDWRNTRSGRDAFPEVPLRRKVR